MRYGVNVRISLTEDFSSHSKSNLMGSRMLMAVPVMIDGRGDPISLILWVLINCQDAPVVYLLVIIQVGSSGNPIAGSRLVVVTVLFLLLSC